MYIPEHFREERVEILHQLIQQHSLATLVTLGTDGLMANHVPLILDPEPAPLGTLRGHLAKANGQWRDSRPDVSALAIFQGPTAYISPSWYATKQETGRVVPTYNYAVVHARGRLLTYDDPTRLERHLRALTNLHEASFPAPWTVDDAPADFFHRMLNSIVGIEIPIERLDGKWKVSQNRPAADREGAALGLRAAGKSAMADLVSKKDRET